MEIFISTLKGTLFAIEARPHDTVEDVKKNIEFVQGAQACHASLLYNGKFLKDGTTLEDNNVMEHDCVFVIPSKALELSDGSTPATAPPAAVTSAPLPSVRLPTPATSNLVAVRRRDSTIKEILRMGAGVWDRETVSRALRAAFNDRTIAIEYLYSGIPKRPVARAVNTTALSGNSTAQAQPACPVAVPNCGPNSSSLSLFPQGLPNKGSYPAVVAKLDYLRNRLDFLRKSQQEEELDKAVPQAIQITSELEAMGLDRALVL